VDYLVLARKYRPQAFEEVVGQESVTTTLRNALASGRVAHAYLFSGPRGVGKTTTARILAKALNCEQGDGPTPSPCHQCGSCRGIAKGDDIDVIEIDAASNTGVDDIRALRDNVRYAPARARFKVYIVDEVHMLSRSAFNAFLKTLEEPPPHVKFIFCTTEPHRLPDTIHSRCQRFDFRRISTDDIVRRLEQICKAEGVEAGQAALRLIARSSKGGMRDSETLLDQLTSYCEGAITPTDVEEALGALPRGQLFALLDHIASHEADKALLLLHSALQDGKDIENLLTQLIGHIRSLLLLSVCGSDHALLDETPEDLGELERQRQRFSTESLLYISQMLWDTLRRVKESAQSRMPLELAIVKLAQADNLEPLTKILERLQALGTRLGTAPARASASAAAAAVPQPARPPDDASTSPPPKQAPAPAHKPRPQNPRPQNPRAQNRGPDAHRASHTEQAHEKALDAQRQIEEQAAQSPVVSEALRILQGTVVKVER
jgi:DNA polymerase-3 subunit gamma/tau